MIRHLLVAFLVTLPVAHAGDYWVDAALGDDANGGTGPADAWRTISFALTQLPQAPGATPDIVHVLPGDYDAALGESFPLFLRDKVRLVGEQGPAATRLHGGLRIGVDDEATSAQTGAEGLSIVDATVGVRIASALPVSPRRRATLRDMVFDGCTRGVGANVSGAGSQGTSLVIEDSAFVSCGFPFNVTAKDSGSLALTLRGVAIDVGTQSCAARALDGAAVDIVLERARLRITTSLLWALRIQGDANGGTARLVLRDSEVTAFCLSTTGIRADATVIERSTITGHDTGVSVDAAFPVVVRDSILYGNGEDLVQWPGGVADVANTCIGTSVYDGQNGNFAADPMFENPALGDYSLRFGSPCIDRLPAVDTLDVFGRPRRADGDLDTVARADVGALEQLPFEGPGAVQLGAPLAFVVHGAAGEVAWIRLSRAAPLASPIATPFGDLWLPATSLVTVGLVATTGETPATFATNAPAHPALAGTTIGYQTLVRSPAAPAGAAWTNALGVLLE